ncbi:sacsin N-terminal ATP-binding-like domain-containing protein [Methylocystis echinoides]|uniref:Sacsin/Nov domain-containing protein n=1 Tax=Methylocystis echinoides TaxID=29468 RepID=A0A9W6GZ34_9HYPH|nr:hypothetical protein [Methylocystis echinoides]GLI95539.1 hypothetical protein LMG27198_45310 [Methylocystis echinoides]
MASDYEKIKADNIRDYGEKTHHLAFLGRLYTDRTHFVFELLQNAEDKNASRVLFGLSEDRLEFHHNGEIFDDRDVRGICGVGEGTKVDDLTKIGKFGIGFKAVYAYTSVPEVHSGNEHFRIDHYVRPSATAARPTGPGWTTLFVLGFDPAKAPAETAGREIAERLRGLTARTLLFLRKIKEIEYELPNGARGIYLREEIGGAHGRLVTVLGESGGKEEGERWLLFERSVPIPGGTGSVAVEIGFKLEVGLKDKIEGIARVRESPLYVFFPTEKQTQFGFLIQGPYRTTPARDNVPKDDEWNSRLVAATAALIVDALHAIKERGLLTVAALNALPIRLDAFPGDGMFYPIVTAVRDALKTCDLLPAEDGTYVAGSNAKLGRGAELRKLLGGDQLSALFPTGRETKWLSGDITADRTADLRAYLMNELEVEEVDPDGFARKISHAFLSAQSDTWFAWFYRYLSGQEALWRAPRWRGDTDIGVLRLKPILRLHDDMLETPFMADGKANAYLPPPEGSDLPCVKREIAADEHAAAFLKRLGLAEPDIFDDIVHRVLPKYNRFIVSVSPDEHAADIQKIFRALGSDSEAGKRKVIEEAGKASFLKATNCSGQTAYKRPGDIYLNDEELRLYFENFPGAWFIDEPLPSGGVGDALLNSLGVLRSPRRIVFDGELPPEIKQYSTRPETIRNYRLDGFDGFVETLKASNSFEDRKARSLVLWRYLVNYLSNDRSFFLGQYEWFYYSNHSMSFDSFMLRQLRETEWLPTEDLGLKKPAGLPAKQLCIELREADDLMKLLFIQTEDQTEAVKELQHAKELGISLDDIEFLKSHPDDFQAWRQSLSERARKPAFPVRTSTDAARGQKRLLEELGSAPEKEYEQRERSVRTTGGMVEPRPWLIGCYTNDDRQMVCQLCHDEMPFKKRDGEYYFEAVEALDRESISIEHEAQFLALCPVCSAKYREFVKSDVVALAAVQRALLEVDSPEIPIMVGDQKMILRFVERHFDRLRTILHAGERQIITANK